MQWGAESKRERTASIGKAMRAVPSHTSGVLCAPTLEIAYQHTQVLNMDFPCDPKYTTKSTKNMTTQKHARDSS